MRRIFLGAAALVVPVLPVLAAAPAYAVDNMICVGGPAGPCDATAASITAAITAANANGVADTIFVGPGTYTDGPYTLASTDDLTLKGSGPGTNITLPAGATQTYISANDAKVQDLKVTLNPTTSTSDVAISVWSGSVVQNVTVVGTGTANATGITVVGAQVTGTDVQMPLTSSRGIFSGAGVGTSTVTDSTITAETGIDHSAAGQTLTVSRTTINVGSYAGVVTDWGTVQIDDSVIDLGTGGGTGLLAANFNNSTTPKTITADHVTIVGGTLNSKGARASAAAAGAKQTATVNLTNSIVRGPTTSLVADASNDGSQGGASTATVNVSHTDFQNTGGTIGANGAGGVVPGAGNLTDVDPAFVDAAGADYHLTLGSSVVDKGNPAAGPPATDRDGHPRVLDGDANGSAIRDLGAYEYADYVPPQTTITGGPAAQVRDTTPTFTFTSEVGATFTCQIDAGAYGACTSPFTTPALANGTHSFRVRAHDGANNIDATPAARSFKVDTVAPNARFTKKPAKRITSKRARFGFTSEAGARYQCKLDKGAWRACTSPRTIAVKKGAHIFRVRALDLAGNVDPTPASFRFRRI